MSNLDQFSPLHGARFEGLELARERDNNAMEAWRDHPYVDIIDNRWSRQAIMMTASSLRADFDSKMNRLIDVVVRRIGIDVGDRFSANARKVKFVISGMPADSAFPVKYTDFQVTHTLTAPGDRVVGPGGPPLPALRPEGVPDQASQESQERPGHLHLHCQEAGAAGVYCTVPAVLLTPPPPGPDHRGEAAHLREGLHQPAGSQG